MSRTASRTLLVVIILLAIAFTYYVFTAPYTRFPGIRIGGELTPAPADWTTVPDEQVVRLKLAGLPPFVIHVWFVPEENGIITATRPDDGYWGNRVRENPDAWMRIADRTYAIRAQEITGAERIPYLEAYGGKYGMPMGYDFAGEVITGTNEPLHTWEVFYWTAR